MCPSGGVDREGRDPELEVRFGGLATPGGIANTSRCGADLPLFTLSIVRLVFPLKRFTWYAYYYHCAEQAQNCVMGNRGNIDAPTSRARRLGCLDKIIPNANDEDTKT